MAKRAMIRIDEDKCNGCGMCIPSCAEGALQIIDGKARLVADKFCDGLGACLGECPQGALTVEERDADEFDLEAAQLHVAASSRPVRHGGGCPGARAMVLPRASAAAHARPSAEPGKAAPPAPSELGQWPVQLQLVSPAAPYFRNADLLVTADCVPFALSDYHTRLLAGHAVAVACPKLDETDTYVNKLAQIISTGDVRSVTVAIMEVPCCGGMERTVRAAVALAGSDIPIRRVVVSLGGEVLSDTTD